MRFCAACTVVLALYAALPASGPAPAGYAPDELLVTLKPGAAFAAPAGCVSSVRVHTAPLGDAALAAQLGLDRTYRVCVGPGANMDSLMERYRRLGCFESVEPNGLVYPHAAQVVYPNDPYFFWLWGIDNRAYFDFGGRWTPKVDADTDCPEAWDITTGDSSVVVAFIDSGCKTSHPELAGRIWRNADEVAGNGRDDDANGYVDDINGWDFAENDNTPQDTMGHGTSTAGVLAAIGNNGIGHVGVDWKCKLMILRVITSGTATMTQVAQAITYAADNGAKVINISLGGSQASAALRNAVDYAHGRGVFIAASSGNDNEPTVSYPAAYTNVVAVGSTDPDDRRSDHFGGSDTASAGSNYGAALDVVAPGNDIYLLNNKDDTLYTINSSGTSLSAPHVCGIASLLLAQDPSRSPDTLRSIIEHSADDMVGDPAEDSSGWDRYMGWGRVSAYQALTYGMTQMRRQALAGRTAVPVFDIRAGRVVVVLPAGSTSGGVMLLLDAAGRQVASVSGRGTRVEMQLSRSLAAGVYLCRLTWGGGEVRQAVTVTR